MLIISWPCLGVEAPVHGISLLVLGQQAADKQGCRGYSRYVLSAVDENLKQHRDGSFSYVAVV